MTVAQAIVLDITSNEYPAGKKLPTISEMLSRYSVSRGTLKESLRYLEFTGIITTKPGPNGGVIVAEPNAHFLARTLALTLEFHQATFRPIVELRQVLEPASAAMAAENASAKMRKSIARSVDLMERSLQNERDFLRRNEQFHELVARASGNVVFTLLVSSLHWITDGSPVGVGYPIERRQAVLAAHRTIAQAIVAGDPDAARKAMERHVAEFSRYLQRFYKSTYERKLRWSDVSL